MSAGNPLDQFTFFPKLPVEVQQAIWGFASHLPRVVEMTFLPFRSKLSQRLESYGITKVKAVWTVPALLQVNFQSRMIAKKFYKLSFADHVVGNPVYFNPYADTLYFRKLSNIFAFHVAVLGRSNFIDQGKYGLLNNVCHIAIGGVGDCVHNIERIGLANIICSMRNLQSVSLDYDIAASLMNAQLGIVPFDMRKLLTMRWKDKDAPEFFKKTLPDVFYLAHEDFWDKINRLKKVSAIYPTGYWYMASFPNITKVEGERPIFDMAKSKSKSTSKPKPFRLTTFTFFPKLAPEIRRMIWKEALPGPNVVRIKDATPENIEMWMQHHKAEVIKVLASYKVPTLLHVNFESRQEAQKVYQLQFNQSMRGNGIYFDFTKDTLFFETYSALAAFHGGYINNLQKFVNERCLRNRTMRKKVRHLAIGRKEWPSYHRILDSVPTGVSKLLVRTENLETLILEKPGGSLRSWEMDLVRGREATLRDRWMRKLRKWKYTTTERIPGIYHATPRQMEDIEKYKKRKYIAYRKPRCSNL
ncbi:hypothetical protein B7494_g6020 [Chlorociboria aeruginascens]|nr:hypothetical protein B7494_g6020 [Chlorociboria aeruginascens]